MPVTQDRLTRLRAFGLSEYAARSYLALLDLGIAEARDVSSISKVPQAKIYHVLEQLHDKGLVVILPEFPKKYAPVPFEEYLSRLHDEHAKAAAAIESEREQLAEMFRVMGDTDVGDRGFFTVIRGRRNVLARIEEMIAQTQRDLIVLGTHGSASRFPHLLPEVRRARERKVRVRVMTPLDKDTVEKLVPLTPLAELRPRDFGGDEQGGKVAIVVSDGARAFLIHFVPDDANLFSGKDIGVFTDQEAMVSAIQSIVEPHWAHAPTFEQRRQEVLEGREAAFTRVYNTVGEAQAAVAQALRRGAKEIMSVAGVGQEEPPAAPGARTRAILDVGDLRAADAAASHSRAGVEARHRHARVLVRTCIFDDREALFGIGEAPPSGSPASAHDVIVHTNSPAIVKGLREQFETMWRASMPLDQRRRELELFPDLKPGDVGLGRLFALSRDAVLVLDAERRVVLWNPAASAAFGVPPEGARGLDAAELFAPEERETMRARMKTAGRDSGETVQAKARRLDGASFAAEVSLTTTRGVDGREFVLVIVRDVTPRRAA